MEKTKEQYRTAIYLRLSKGDGDVDGTQKAESNSISNQRLIIGRYLQEHPEMTLTDTYIDDGFTGTNFERPEMKRLLKDVEAGLIDCIIVKDLSRFGREKNQTGQYIARYFKDKDVRFIAITDHYDSMTANGTDNHLLMPIKTLTNDSYSRDISMKVRSSQAVKREMGECISPYAPYGYLKDPEDHNHLIPDPDAGKVVQKIFAMRISGISANAIAKELEASAVLGPSAYKKKCIKNYPQSRVATNPYHWTCRGVLRILENEVYIGNMVQGRKQKVSYKINKIVDKPKEDWVIVEGTHEPLISKGDFEIVQSLLKRDCMRQGDDPRGYLYTGLLYCGDCGRSMHRKGVKSNNGTRIKYVCGGHNKGSNCTSHRIWIETLDEILIQCLNQRIQMLCHYGELARNLEQMEINLDLALEHDEDIQKLREELLKYDRLKASLYQDLKEGLLNEQQFDRYREQYQAKEAAINQAIQKQEQMIKNIYKHGIAADSLLQKFRKHPKIEKLDRVLLVTLIDRILIYENNEIEIVYRYKDEIDKLQSILTTNMTERKGVTIDGKNEESL